MSDPINDFLTGAGIFPRSQQLVFNSHFMGRSTTVVPYDEMPRQYREYLDDFAVTVLDPDGSKIIVTGNPLVGKTFLIEQLYANRDVFLKRSGQQALEFVNVPLEHARLVENSLPGKWQAYVEMTTKTYQANFEDIVYVTESVDAAIGISNIGGRVILELSLATLHHLHKHESAGMVKQWASWEVLDLNDAYLNKQDMIQLLSASLLDKLNTSYPEIHMTKKHISMFVTYAIKEGELLIDADMDETREGLLVAQPGIFARAVGRLASLMAISAEVRDTKGNVQLSKAIKRTFADFEDYFFSCLQSFIESAEGTDMDDPSLEDALREMIETNMPGVRVMSIQGAGAQGKRAVAKPEKAAEFTDFKTLEGRLSASVLGQAEAIREVVDGLKIPAAGLNLNEKPLRSLLFLGPTGVGKTQLALSLAQELMTEELPVKRIDMSEFGQEHEASKLLGAPPGYAGHDEGGVLTNFVKQFPNSIVVLDEIEKAHPKVWDSFLQILDAGRMTDGKGQTVDFTNTIVIMTSNLGADELARPHTGFLAISQEELYKQRNSEAKNIVRKAVESRFRPEMVNRIDQMVIFNELPQHILRDVIAKEIGLVSERLGIRGYQLDSPKSDILDYIANMADASKYGAREVQRVIGKNVYGLLADTVLADKEKKGLKLAIKDGKLTVRERKIGNTDGSATE